MLPILRTSGAQTFCPFDHEPGEGIKSLERTFHGPSTAGALATGTLGPGLLLVAKAYHVPSLSCKILGSAKLVEMTGLMLAALD